MKTLKLAVVTVLTALLLAGPTTLLADDGADLYKAKCAGCHGPQGEGKPAMKAPTLKGTALNEEQILTVLQKGDASKKTPHTAPFKAISEADAKAIATFVKSLK
jgi:mono/diheme cytochrome c family protein